MESRERIIALTNGEKTDRVPYVIHWSPWAQTLERWKQEGMKQDDDWRTPFGFDPFHEGVGVNFGICPAFEAEVLEDEGFTVVTRDAQGTVKRDRKDGLSMPQFLDYPVKDRKSWEEHKWRFDPETPERFPPDWDEQAKRLRNSEALVSVGMYPYGFYGGVRTMMGAEGSLIACADDPELVEDINEHLCHMWSVLYGRVFEETRVDEIAFWEDMAGRQGSLISPAMFRRFMSPHYRHLIELGKRHGLSVFSVDSDGLIHELTELFLETGINAPMPYEVQAGNDIPAMLCQHPTLCAWGGMDKRVMAQGHREIDEEMERVAAIVELGRFLPFPDHLIPPDATWDNYQYFVWRWKEMLGVG